MTFISVDCVLHIECFVIGKTYLPRELAIVGRDDFKYHRCVDLSGIPVYLFRDRTNFFIQDRLTGLPFHPGCWEAGDLIPIREVTDVVKKILDERNYSLVGFKGDRMEAEILTDLDIPGINLGTLGCPKFKELPRRAPCSYHTLKVYGPIVHCALAKATSFWEWLQI